MTGRRKEQDSEDLLAFIEQGAHRIGKSVDIPSPEGRTQAGWTMMQNLKVQPEVVTMLEQLREHKLFRGKWKTGAQVAWSMIYLGLQSCYQFYAKESEEWKDYRSNFMALQDALRFQEQERKQKQLTEAARVMRANVHMQLNKATEFGKYKAWQMLDKCIEMRDTVEDVKQFDLNMRMPGAPVLDSNLVFDNRAGEYWTKLFPVVGGDLDDDAADLIYTDLTTAYFDELEEMRAKKHEED